MMILIVEQIEKTIKEYYQALDNREHGGIAMDKAFKEIEKTLDMSWSKYKNEMVDKQTCK